MSQPQDPYRSPDEDARALARDLIRDARFGALAVLDPATAAPAISRIAVAPSPAAEPEIWALVSALAQHSRALAADPRAALLLGEPGRRGDPLTHPRISLTIRAERLPRDDPGHEARRAHWLATHPKAGIYVDLPDFTFLRLRIEAALLNGGFGRAYRLLPEELAGNGSAAT